MLQRFLSFAIAPRIIHVIPMKKRGPGSITDSDALCVFITLSDRHGNAPYLRAVITNEAFCGQRTKKPTELGDALADSTRDRCY